MKVSALPDISNPQTPDFQRIADFIALQALDDDEQRDKIERLAKVIDVPIPTAKQMVFKRKALIGVEPEEVKAKIQYIADAVEVTYSKARDMVTIQPGLLFDVERQAETLALGIKAICYELGAPKEEVVELILKHNSVLHGREMHLSVADIAHLAVIREPLGRIVE